MSGIDDIVKEKFEDIDGVVYLKGRGKVNISKYFLEEIAYKVAKEIFKDIRNTIKGTGCKEAEDGSVLDIETYDIDAKEFIKKEKEWLGDKQ